jgi:hypothetical protein
MSLLAMRASVFLIFALSTPHGAEAQGALTGFFLGGKKHSMPFAHPDIEIFLPSAEERHDMKPWEHAQRTSFFICFFLGSMAVFVLVIELMIRITNCCTGSNYLPLSKVSPRGENDAKLQGNAVTGKVGPVVDFQQVDMLFLWYKTSYEYSCAGLVAYAVYNDFIDSDFGLDFEVYIPWFVECLLMHFVCTICAIVHCCRNKDVGRPIGSALMTVPVTCMPFISERWNLLRDFITIGIYVSQHTWPSYVCAAIVLISLIVVFFLQSETPTLIRSLRFVYWPIGKYLMEEEDEIVVADASAASEKVFTLMQQESLNAPVPSESSCYGLVRMMMLQKADQATREHCRINTAYGEFPQGIAAVLYMVSTRKISHFVLMCCFIYAGKAFLLFVLRPYALCALAASRKPWAHVTEGDLDKILKTKDPLRDGWRRICDWRLRSFNALQILREMREHKPAIEAAIRGLGNLFDDRDSEGKDVDEDLDPKYLEIKAALVLFLIELTRDKKATAVNEALCVAVLQLCPGLEKRDLATAAPVKGNLGYVPSGDSMHKAQLLIDKMQGGVFDWRTVLKDVKANVHPPSLGASQDDLMICISDLEPDDSMAIAQLWQLNVEKYDMGREPMVVYLADFKDKEKGTIFEKKVLMTSLMVGSHEFHVLTPEKKWDQLRDAEEKPPEVTHPAAKYWDDNREAQLGMVVENIINFTGKTIHLYIMAPGRGNIGAIVKKLKDMGQWPLKKSLKVSIYSGGFNIRSMSPDDMAAIKEFAIMSNNAGNTFIDAAKFPFFGGKDNHPWTESFTTFAPDQFAGELNLAAHPLLIAFLKMLHIEFNKGLIAPNKLYKSRPLTKVESARFEAIKAKFAADRLQEYCNDIVDDFVLYCKVPDFKKSTVAAFATGSCDSPLCDQLSFLIEYLMVRSPGTLRNMEPGKWVVDVKKGFTSVNTKEVASAPDTMAMQPILRDPMNEQDLAMGRRALQEYLIRHLHSLRARDEYTASGEANP